MTATPPPTPDDASTSAFSYVHSPGFADILEGQNVSLLVTTYQAGKLVVFRARGGRVSALFRSFEQPMGLAADVRRLALGTRSAIWFFRNAPDIAPQLDPPGLHDACFLPRSCHVTGDIRGHQLAWANDELWIVNTRFSCLCTLHPDWSFVPRWRPPFISALVAEDRCHLNGLVVASGQPRYVTALSETDTAEGWRPGKATGGCLLDVAAKEVVLRGLCMPHSPALHQGRLWLLNSGRGQLGTVDLGGGRFEPVAELPGYTRALACHGPFAFVGLSRIRETSTFGGLPIAERATELKCGIWVVDLRTGQVAGFAELTGEVSELFDLAVLPGLRFPAVVGLQKDTIQRAFVIPPETITAES